MDMIFDIAENVLVAELFGEMDHHAAQKIREDIDTAMSTYNMKDLVFDFSRVTFMDSSGIGVILGRYRKLNETGGRVVIAGCSPAIRNILNMAGIFSLIDYFSTRREATDFLCRKEAR